jgi:succinate dehydrogenase / fumarate reductase membrane anchor subunit
MSFRSPLSTARGLGAAKKGVASWIALRVSSIALIPLTFWLLYSIVQITEKLSILSPLEAREELYAWFMHPANAIFSVLFVIFGFHHAALGMKEVFEDYIHNKFWKYCLLVLNDLVLFAVGAATVFAILGMYFRG